MMLHEEIRAARLKAGLSQEALARAAGIPRNQVARAERGENITLDTLRKIAVQLPVDQLSLINMKTLIVDVMPEAEQLFTEATQTVIHLTMAMRTALTHALTAGKALESARRRNAILQEAQTPAGEEQTRPDVMTLLRSFESTVDSLLSTYQFVAGREAQSLSN
jgi:transcriptional regulator with XRE-family HTH domain